MRKLGVRTAAMAAACVVLGACATAGAGGMGEGNGAPAAASPRSAAAAQEATIPPGAAEAAARLAASPRHGEWATIRMGADSMRAWVVYPERRDKAPVVVVVHEIFGLSTWVRAVADQLAADGFVAVAPDLLTMKNVPMGPDGAPIPDSARAAIRSLTAEEANRLVYNAAMYGMSLPAAEQRYGVVGFCWGGSTVFAHAARSAMVGATVVYYGTSPQAGELATINKPVLGLYGENDARVNATIAPADSAMKENGKSFEYHIYPGAGHGFLRQQEGQNGANLQAARAAWPATIAFFRRHLGS